MGKQEEILEKSRKLRGEILSAAIWIEIDLTREIRNYFFKKSGERDRLFYWEILNTKKFGFDDKVNLFKTISPFKKRKHYEKIVESLTFIKKLRNIMAHWDVLINESDNKKIVFCDTSKFGRKINKNKARFAVDAKILDKFDEEIVFFHTVVCKTHNLEKENLKNLLNK